MNDSAADASTDPPAPTPPATPTPPAPVPAPTPLTPVAPLEIRPPDALPEAQRDGATFYFRGRTEGTGTTGPVDVDGTPTPSETRGRTTTVEAGASYGSGDRNGDGVDEHQVRTDLTYTRRSESTNGVGTATDTFRGSGSYVFTPGPAFRAWGEAGVTTTSTETTRTTTTYGEVGLEGRIPNDTSAREVRATGDRLTGELRDLYLDPAGARTSLDRLDGGFAAGGASFAGLSETLRTRGDTLGAQTAAGALGGTQTTEAITALADQTQARIDTLRGRSPETFGQALSSVEATRGAFNAAYGESAQATWNDFQARADAVGYAEATRGLPAVRDGSPVALETLQRGASALEGVRGVVGPEVMNAAEDQIAIRDYRAQTATPGAPAPGTPAPETRPAPAPEPMTPGAR